jgi:hypothetical protein
MWWMIGVSVVSTAVVLFLLGRRNERAVKRDWALLLSPRGEQLYKKVEGQVQADLMLADLTYDKAFAVRELGSVDEAIRLLDAGYRAIENFAPSMMKLLAAMATFSRMVSAMAPMRPLRPGDFRLAEIASLAYLNRLLHQFLVSTAERFRLRLYIIGRSFGIATRYLLNSTRRLAQRQTESERESEREWEQIQAIRQDFQSLTDESLESLRVLISSLEVEKKGEVLKRISG